MTHRWYDTRVDDDWSWRRLKPGDTVFFSRLGGIRVFDAYDNVTFMNGVFLVLACSRTKTHHGLLTLNVWLYVDGAVFRQRINDLHGDAEVV